MKFTATAKIIVKPHESIPDHSVVDVIYDGNPNIQRYELVPDVLVDELTKEIEDNFKQVQENILSHWTDQTKK